MSALEQEIIEKFHQLQPAAKKRVLTLLEQEVAAQEDEKTRFNYAAWSRKVKALREQIRAGQTAPLDVVEILRDIRDGEDE